MTKETKREFSTAPSTSSFWPPRPVDIYAPICSWCDKISEAYDGTDPRRYACRDHAHCLLMAVPFPKPKLKDNAS